MIGRPIIVLELCFWNNNVFNIFLYLATMFIKKDSIKIPINNINIKKSKINIWLWIWIKSIISIVAGSWNDICQLRGESFSIEVEFFNLNTVKDLIKFK